MRTRKQREQRDQIAETEPGANNSFWNRLSVAADDANGVTRSPSAESQTTDGEIKYATMR
jgi:hypothetical protein